MNIFTQFRRFPQLLILVLLLFSSNLKAQDQFCIGLETRIDDYDPSELLLDLTSENFEGVIGMQFSIAYDTDDYEFVELVENNFPADNSSNYSSLEAGIINVVWIGDVVQGNNLPNDHPPLLTFKFRRLTNNLSPFEFVEDPTTIEFVFKGANGFVLNNVINCVTGETLIQSVNGQFAYDENNNCIGEAAEIADAANHNWRGWNVSAVQDGQYYLSGYPFANGSYNLKLFEGDNTVRVSPPSLYYEICEPVLTVNPAEIGEDEVLEHLIKVKERCPFMEVNLASFADEPCKESIYFVQYANNGTATAEAAYIELNLDYRIVVDEINVPTVDLGNNKYLIPLGDIEIGQSGSIFAQITLPCDLSPEETLRNEARIYPNEICGEIDQEWSGASLKVNGRCENGKVVFEVENVGKGDMSEPLEYVVIEDAIIFRTQAVQLASGAKEVVALDANGATYYLQIPQENGHPGNSRRPSTYVEACGRDETGTFSTGFANRFPMDDNDFFVDIDYQLLRPLEQTSALMSNPIGFTEEHLINPDDFIEYQIFFNNVGVNTEIVIIDTLSEFLDPTSFEPVLSNQAYGYTIQNNILKLTIPLNTNTFDFDLYNFIKFKIKPKADIPNGTIILNQATIYKGEELTETNSVFHTVKKDFLQTSTSTNTNSVDLTEPKLTIYPNPSADIVTFKLEEIDSEEHELLIYNSFGQVIKTVIFNENTYRFHKGDMPAGSYFYQLQKEFSTIQSGFFVLID